MDEEVFRYFTGVEEEEEVSVEQEEDASVPGFSFIPIC